MNSISSSSGFIARSHFPKAQLIASAFIAWMLLLGQFAIAKDKTSINQKKKAKQSVKQELMFTVSHETSYVTQPLDQEGYVDYLAALNQKSSEGVTVDNNAAILFAKAGVGLSDFKPDAWERYCKMLGIEWSTDSLLIFKPIGELNHQEEAEFKMVTTEPWLSEEHPHFTKWIIANEKPLEVIVEGTKRSRCYIPLVRTTESETLIGATAPVPQACRQVARCLVARAMLRLKEGKIVEAEQDLLACHRLGRLIGCTPGLVSLLSGIAINRVAGHGDVALIQFGKLTAADALAHQTELRKLPVLPAMPDEIAFTERLICLDVLASIIRCNQASIMKSKKAFNRKTTADLKIMYDESMRVINEAYDKLAAAGQEPTVALRKQRSQNLIYDMEKARTLPGLTDPEMLEIMVSLYEPVDIGSQIVASLLAQVAATVDQAYEAENRSRMRDDLGQLGFALAAYHADHRVYPESLDALSPTYISTVPKDLYNDQPLHFVRKTDGYLLYCVGPNFIDDHGQESGSELVGDDIALQILH